jgi:hypothetical protein
LGFLGELVEEATAFEDLQNEPGEYDLLISEARILPGFDRIRVFDEREGVEKSLAQLFNAVLAVELGKDSLRSA